MSGTDGNDAIIISPADAAGQSVTVRINGVLQPGGPFSPTGHILVYGQTGNDVIKVVSATIDGQAAKVAIPAILFGGAGNDTLSAAGSSANNVLVGGAGNDNTTGGSGRDLQIGGAGADLLRAGGSDNALIGGSTIHDLDAAALLALAAEWSRTDIDYQNRVHHLFGSDSGGLNGASRLDPQAVIQDTAIDQLFGGTSGMDWFWMSTSIKATTKLKSYAAGEVATFE